jgi:tight adherence protein C
MIAVVLVSGAVALVLFASGLPGFAPRGIERRISPYLPSTRSAPWRQGGSPHRSFDVPWLGSDDQIEGRLRSAGKTISVQRFRFERWLCAVTAGLLIPAWLLWVQSAAGRVSLGPVLLAGIFSAVSAFAWRDRALNRAIRSRAKGAAEQLPLMLDLLAISVTAGESIDAAIRRTARALEGTDIGDELRRLISMMSAGQPTAGALESFARGASHPRLQRFARSLSLAIENGTPVASVLTAQSVDAREEERRSLLEAGAKREIWMLVPVVFVLLPTVVLIVFYPSLVALDMFVP